MNEFNMDDAKNLMTSDDYQQRLVSEYVSLKIRTKRLRACLNTGKIPMASYKLLMTQLCAMEIYLNCLEQRFFQESIILPQVEDNKEVL